MSYQPIRVQPVTIHTTATDLLVAAALADVRARQGHPHLLAVADRLTKAAAEAERQQPTRLGGDGDGQRSTT